MIGIISSLVVSPQSFLIAGWMSELDGLNFREIDFLHFLFGEHIAEPA
jgi:hypothetical protein